MFDWDEAKRISAFARDKGIAMHLDGARLFIASAYTGISPAEYSAHFDTVYVSLWKYFNCGIGAILAGPKRVLDGMFHVRRMFGGNLAVGWNAALVARHFMTGSRDGSRAPWEFGAVHARWPKPPASPSNAFRTARTDARDVQGVKRRVARRLGERGIAVGPPSRDDHLWRERTWKSMAVAT